MAKSNRASLKSSDVSPVAGARGAGGAGGVTGFEGSDRATGAAAGGAAAKLGCATTAFRAQPTLAVDAVAIKIVSRMYLLVMMFISVLLPPASASPSLQDLLETRADLRAQEAG